MELNSKKVEPEWLHWAWRLQAIARNGLTYALNEFDIERFEAVQQIAAEIVARHTQLSEEEVIQIYTRQSGYETPKVDVRAAVFRDGKILLVKERLDGLWTLPGGWSDPTDSPRQAVEREVFEESGYIVRATKLAAVLDRSLHGHTPPFPFHVYKLFFVAELLGGTPVTSHEILEVGFFAEDDLPPLSLGRVVPDQIVLLFDHQRRPGRPTDFD